MKLSFIGAGGARTPLVIQSILDFRERLPRFRVAMMDIDAGRLDLMRTASKPFLARAEDLQVEWTTDAHQAIDGADFIVTTFRAGLMASRVIDEQVPLKYGVLGQETTGPGGFAMALRTIPTMLGYVRLIQELAPDAWLLNFTNPAGIVTEAITRVAGFERAVGICDNPATMVRAVAALLGVEAQALFAEYYGLNHLGWLRAVYLDGKDQVPEIVRAIAAGEVRLPGLPFDPGLLEALAAIPNEYLYFYYSPQQAVENLVRAGQSRAQQILPFNQELYATLKRMHAEESDPDEVAAVYSRYLDRRHGSYMTLETGVRDGHALSPGSEGQGDHTARPAPEQQVTEAAEGYTGVTLRLIEALKSPVSAVPLILNVPNRGALPGMADDDVVEVTCHVGNGIIRPLAMGPLPDHALGLMKSVKAFERLTIQAAVDGSYNLAVEALALHPLVPSYETARSIVEDYIVQHKEYFPTLS